MYPASIQRLIDLFSRFPTIGQRTAGRFVFYLLKLPQAEFNDLVNSMQNLRDTIKTCSFCFNHFDKQDSQNESELCSICQNPSRDRTLLSIVEKETDLVSIENTKRYKGLYFIMGTAALSPKKEEAKILKLEELEERIKNPGKFGLKIAGFREIIIATNSTTEGEAIGLYVERKIKALAEGTAGKEPLKITHLGRGLPVGGELEYADEETLGSAFDGRK